MDNFFEELKKQILKDDNDHLEEKGISKELFTGENLKQPGIGVLKIELTIGEVDGKIANGVVCATAPGGGRNHGINWNPKRRAYANISASIDGVHKMYRKSWNKSCRRIRKRWSNELNTVANRYIAVC